MTVRPTRSASVDDVDWTRSPTSSLRRSVSFEATADENDAVAVAAASAAAAETAAFLRRRLRRRSYFKTNSENEYRTR